MIWMISWMDWTIWYQDFLKQMKMMMTYCNWGAT
jgi:hypothetical protein